MMAAAFDAGVNFFDNAEVYAGGRSEEVMGQALKALGWPRLNYIVSTKFFWGLDRKGEAVNRKDTLNRKYLMQAIDGSLQRFGLEHIDLVYCHRPDPHTPIEETVRAMSDMITQGKALYWGTSEWSAADIRAAWEVADRHHLHKPVMEQPQYHLFHRKRVEQEYARLYDDIGLGLTTWSPLASGLLTGKYRSRRARGQPRRAGEHGLPARRPDWMRGRTPPWRSSSPSRPSSAARWRSWPSPGRRRTRASAPSSPARRAGSAAEQPGRAGGAGQADAREVMARIDAGCPAHVCAGRWPDP
jgi:aryl-alcohol dehydrogenase-like predicted oxidoreductase